MLDMLMQTSLRTVDKLGRVVLPQEFRAAVGIQEGDKVQIRILDAKARTLVIEPETIRCSLCFSRRNPKPVNQGYLCIHCIDKVRE